LLFRYAFLILKSVTNFSVSAVPLINWDVTSAPTSLITLALPSNTSIPSPWVIQARYLGVGSPPSCSGQKGTVWVFFREEMRDSVAFDRPLKRQFKPKRHALTKIMWYKSSLSEEGKNS